jgi:hypothetical protein
MPESTFEQVPNLLSTTSADAARLAVHDADTASDPGACPTASASDIDAGCFIDRPTVKRLTAIPGGYPSFTKRRAYWVKRLTHRSLDYVLRDFGPKASQRGADVAVAELRF